MVVFLLGFFMVKKFFLGNFRPAAMRYGPAGSLHSGSKMVSLRSRLANYTQRRSAAVEKYPFRKVTNPDLAGLYTDEMAIVYSWANGSSPKYIDLKLKACRRTYGASALKCKKDWRLERSRDSGEILFSLRSIGKNMPWFNGNVYIVTATGEGPEGLDYSNPKLHLVHQKNVMPPENVPSFCNDCQEYYFNNIPELKDRFIVMDDDMFIGRLAPPGGFLSQFGGPVLYVEKELVKDGGICPCIEGHVWRCSVCKTMKMFEDFFGPGAAPFHYMKHSPRVYSRQVIDYIHSIPTFDYNIRKRGCIHPFRSVELVQFDFLHHHVLMQTALHDFSVAKGWSDDMNLVLLEGKDLGAWQKLTQEWAGGKSTPLFFAINDEGWDNCAVGDVLLEFLKRLYPIPSRFEKGSAVNHIKLSNCRYNK